MRKLKVLLAALPLVIIGSLFVGCGDDKEAIKGSRELLQGVNQIPFSLGRANLEMDIRYADGTDEQIRRNVKLNSENTLESVERVIHNDRFVLVVNGEQAALDMTPDGKISFEAEANNRVEGCKLNGHSNGTGLATHKEINLDWELVIDLQGDGCQSVLGDKFRSYFDQEMGRLKLNFLKNSIASIAQSIDKTSHIRLRLSLSGNSH